MADPQSLEEFDHLHRDALRNLDVEKVQLSAAGERLSIAGLDDDLKKTLDQIRQELTELATGPENVFRRAVTAMSNAERKRFIIDNALEVLKSGKSVPDVLKTFGEIGLFSTPEGAAGAIANLTPLPTIRALLETRSIWNRVSLSIYQVAVNAVKTVPRWVEIEPHVGFVGPVPAITFGLKGKGMTAYEFLEALRTGAE